MKTLIKSLIKGKISFDILFILLLSLTPLLWFRGNSIMVGHDNVFPLDPAIFLSGRLYTWIGQDLGQSQALIMGTIPIHLIDVLPSIFGFSLQTTQKIVYVFWFFMMGISAYILACAINKESRVFKLTAVILYQFNFFILQGWWIGERTKFSAYIAFPLVLAVFLKVYRKELNVFRAAIYNSLILFIFNGGGLFGTPLFGGYFIGITTFILFFSLLSFLRKQYDVVKKLILLTLLSSFGFFLVNAYYIFPAFSEVFSHYIKGVEKTGGVQGLINWASEISANASYINLFRLQGIAEWYDNLQHPYAKYYLSNSILIVLSFLWPLLIFLTVILIKERKKLEIVLYLFLVYLLGIFFAAGTHPPLGFIYAFLMETIPGFVIFRSPFYKFAPAIFLASTFLMAFFLDYFKGWFKKIFFVAFVIFVLAYHFPYFTANFFSWRTGFSTRNIIPDYVFSFGKWVEENGDSGRILMLPPTNPAWQYDIYNWGYLSFQSLPTLVTNQGIISNDDKINNEEQQLVLKLYEAVENKDRTLVEKLIDVLGIKYFLVRNDAKFDLDWAPTNPPAMYKKILESDFGLYPLEKFGEWEVYVVAKENPPKFFLAEKLNILEDSDKYADIYYDFSDKESQLLLKSERQSSLEELKGITSEYVLPKCLNCRNEIPPSLYFSERLILPGSFLYPFLMFNENRETAKKSGKELVYNDLGLSVKRIGEIDAMLKQSRRLKEDLFDNYIDLLRRLARHFQQLSLFRDKFETAESIHYYLQKEREYIGSLSGSRISSGDLAQKLDTVFSLISYMEEEIDSYLFKLDFSNNRFYQFSVNNSETYEFFLRKDDVSSIAKEKSKFKIVIDDKDTRELELDQEMLDKRWFSFGRINVSLGDHRLLLTVPELQNLRGDFRSDKNRLAQKPNDNCFSAGIRNFDNKKVYKLNMELTNDFSEKFYLSTVIKKKKGQDKLSEVIKFENHFEKDNYQSLIYSKPDTDDVFLYLCSANLTADILRAKVKLTVKEVIRPVLILVPQDRNGGVITNVSYKKLNPTKYIVNFNNPNKTSVLVFTERFNVGWKLSGLSEDRRLRLNGFANGWIINGKGSETLILEYRPQTFFYIGSILSGLSVLFGLLYLLIGKNRKL